ncbi:sensor domain-containing diguanylate cyclase [Spirochaeta isovalerica]|uniref:diguanylate cyclase n=1 Tax=Spirochaeta isovalerica TaxID=150 RepID=A0A841R9W9_9SPIO|nr:diguanylate cyclase [Spirochaeta isovalerica]MBB6480556.1 diguanylate cyclase (GGDEF)-like protein [Spirochaeta isovalerica]
MRVKNFLRETLYGKILLTMILTATVTILSIIGLQEAVLKKSYIELEEELSLKNLNRLTQAIERDASYIGRLLLDWSIWDDTYDFVLTGNREYIESNLSIDSLYNISLNFMFFYNRGGDLIWGEFYDFDKWEKVPCGGFSTTFIQQRDLLFNGDEDYSRSGLIDTAMGLLFMAAGPVFKSDRSGPAEGTLIIGKLIDERFIEKMKEVVQGEFSLYSENREDILWELNRSEQSYLMEKDENRILLYKAIEDLEGRKTLVVESRTERNIWQYGQRVTSIFITFILLLIILFTVIILILIRVIYINPLHKITLFLQSWKKESGSPVSLDMNRVDEIGTLSRGINSFSNELRELATTDSLTGLNNRHLMDTLMPGIWNIMSRDRSEITIILMDIDYFKKYNDTYGHQAGDRCLKEVGAILKSSIRRSSDMVIRYGGEEFLLILPATPISGGLMIANKIQERLEKKSLEHKSSEIYRRVTMSLGISSGFPNSDNNLDQLIEQADSALYESKEAGRNRITLYRE